MQTMQHTLGNDETGRREGDSKRGGTVVCGVRLRESAKQTDIYSFGMLFQWLVKATICPPAAMLQHILP
jgi:hypothetical protein